MDAPLITRDPSANTTDVYAFVSERGGVKYLNLALGFYPHQEPGIGPNKYNFDDDVLCGEAPGKEPLEELVALAIFQPVRRATVRESLITPSGNAGKVAPARARA